MTSIYHIDKIELSDTATKLHVTGIHFPNSTLRFGKDLFLKDYKTEKKYPIINIDNYELGEKIIVPESGEKTVVLTFPPLDKGVKKINYKFAIFEISLDKSRTKEEAEALPETVSNWFETELQKDTEAPLKEFTATNFFSNKPAKLVGYIKGYDKRVGFSTIMMYLGNVITREEQPIIIEILPDGRFSSELPLTNPIISFLSINRQYLFNLYFEPNQTTGIILDWEQFLEAKRRRDRNYLQKTAVFKGNLAKTNQELFLFKSSEFDYRAAREKIKTETPTAYKEDLTNTLNTDKIKLSTYIEQNKLSSKSIAILKNDLKIEYAIRLFDFVSSRKYEARKDTANTILKVPAPVEYYDFLKDFDFTDYSLMTSDKFKIFINRFEFSEPLSIRPKPKSYSIKPEKSFEGYIKEINYRISEKDKKLLEQKRKSYTSKEHKEFINKFSDSYKKHFKDYNDKYIKPLEELNKETRKKDYANASIENWKLKDSILENSLQLKKNIAYEITKLRSLKFDLEQMSSKYAHEYWSEFEKQITHPFLQAEGARMTQKIHPIYTIEKDLEKNGLQSFTAKAKIKKLPEGKATTVFKNIVDKHKGKILFVDFWATTCGP
jgi:hypothetical protein